MSGILDTLIMALPKYLAFLFALCFHEFAHGYMALKRGDPTAKIMGRLTLNPIAHADIIGTVVLPLLGFMMPGSFLFGWAQPVPVNSRNLHRPRADLFWIAAAGPLSNILLAVLGALCTSIAVLVFYNSPIFHSMLQLLYFFVQINLVLAAFNLIPIHPLDGGKVLARFLPERWNRKLEDNQMALGIILMVLVLSGSLGFIFGPVAWLSQKLMVWALALAEMGF